MSILRVDTTQMAELTSAVGEVVSLIKNYRDDIDQMHSVVETTNAALQGLETSLVDILAKIEGRLGTIEKNMNIVKVPSEPSGEVAALRSELAARTRFYETIIDKMINTMTAPPVDRYPPYAEDVRAAKQQDIRYVPMEPSTTTVNLPNNVLGAVPYP